MIIFTETVVRQNKRWRYSIDARITIIIILIWEFSMSKGQIRLPAGAKLSFKKNGLLVEMKIDARTAEQ